MVFVVSSGARGSLHAISTGTRLFRHDTSGDWVCSRIETVVFFIKGATVGNRNVRRPSFIVPHPKLEVPNCPHLHTHAHARALDRGTSHAV